MSIRDLRDKYGGVKGNMAINDAIRSELPGGKKLLDLTAWLFREKNLNEREQRTLDALFAIQNEMKQYINEKYQLKNRKEGYHGNNENNETAGTPHDPE
jgi:hypothetical protein